MTVKILLKFRHALFGCSGTFSFVGARLRPANERPSSLGRPLKMARNLLSSMPKLSVSVTMRFLAVPWARLMTMSFRTPGRNGRARVEGHRFSNLRSFQREGARDARYQALDTLMALLRSVIDRCFRAMTCNSGGRQRTMSLRIRRSMIWAQI